MSTLDLLWIPEEAATNNGPERASVGEVKTEPRYLVLPNGERELWPNNLVSVQPTDRAHWMLARVTCQRCGRAQSDGLRADGLVLTYTELGAIRLAQLLRRCRL